MKREAAVAVATRREVAGYRQMLESYAYRGAALWELYQKAERVLPEDSMAKVRRLMREVAR